MRIRHRLSLAVIPITAMGLLGTLALPNPSAHAADKKTPATGRVHYRMNSPMMNGTMTMTWINHGKKFRQDMKLSVGQQGKQMSINSWTVADGGYIYTYQPSMGQQVMRMKMPKEMAAAGALGLPSPGAAGGGKVVGKGKILGYPCEIRTVGPGGKQGQAKLWIWNGMPLKMEAAGPQGQGMTMVATRVETAPKVSLGDFKVPAGYQVRDVQPPTGAPPAGSR
jgi:hypothetical protein